MATGSKVLANTVVVITGAGRGLGAALVGAFSEAGATVIALGRNADALQSVTAAADASRCHWRVMDVADGRAVRDCFAALAAEFGRLDILFNNAAVYPKENFLDQSAESWDAAIATNVLGVANCCRAVLPIMIENGYGRIFNVGSFADGSPIEDSSAYSASKGALHALTKSISVDIAALGLDIEIHEWVPGHLNTRMSGFTGIDPKVSAAWAVDLAIQRHESHHSRLFVNDAEQLPPRRLKDRVLDRLLLRRGRID